MTTQQTKSTIKYHNNNKIEQQNYIEINESNGRIVMFI